MNYIQSVFLCTLNIYFKRIHDKKDQDQKGSSLKDVGFKDYA